MLLAQIRETWRAPFDLSDPGRLIVVLAIELNPDGTVRGQPRVVSPGGYAGDPAQRNAVEQAMRAVQQRRQFDLPEDRYEEWRSFQFRFDPRELS
jgi:periplasmic protein TonB